MSTDVHIKDATNNNGLAISEDGSANVAVFPRPPIDDKIGVLPFREYFLNGASNDMAVDGDAAETDFVIEASPDYDIYIKSISVVIGDGGSPTLNKFGALAELTNGVCWFYKTDSEGDYTLHDGIKTNLEFIRIGVDTAGIGTGTDAYLADVSGGGTEKSYLPTIDMAETFGMPFGLRLQRGRNDTLRFRVRDDLSDLTTFNIIAYGIRI